MAEDEDIEQTRSEEQSLATPAKREAAAIRRNAKLYTQKAKQAKLNRDSDGFTVILKSANVRKNSPEWIRAWEWFYSA